LPKDAPALAELTVAAIAMIGLRAYSIEQVLAWAARHPGATRFLEGAEAGEVILVALSANDDPAAYAILQPKGHLDVLYCHPDHAGKGFASALLAAIESEALARGHPHITTHASELARPVFERAGYVLLHRQDFTIAMGGDAVPIHNYAMTKSF
ncbi:MAG TPA: GNAT family N-acetyltransferase, partial [Erythrobacter sp.]|nr:GNAT family N-acetyltransferase [Erythrobacter sp.]